MGGKSIGQKPDLLG